MIPYPIEFYLLDYNLNHFLHAKTIGQEWVYLVQLADGKLLGCQSTMDLALGEKIDTDLDGQTQTLMILMKCDRRFYQDIFQRGDLIQ